MRNLIQPFALLAFAVLLLPLPGLAQSPSPSQSESPPLVSNVFYQSDLRQALEDIAAQAQVNIVADPSVQGVVSVTLEDATVEEALQLVLAGTEYEVHRNGIYWLVYSPDEGSPIFPEVAETRAIVLENLAPETARSLLPDSLQRYVRADGASGRLAVTAPPQILTRILAEIDILDRTEGGETMFYALRHVKGPTARSLLPETLQRFVRVDAERNTLAIDGPPETRNRIVEQIQRLDRPLSPGSFDVPDVHRTEVVKLNHSKAASVVNLLPPALQEYVRGDEETNTVAVAAPPELRRGILADIAAIDVPRGHIMLDARVVVLERVDLLDFGGEWEWPEISAGTFTGDGIGAWPWELRIGYSPSREFTNALSLTLNMLSANGEATVIASPQVLAQDGKEAEIRVTTEEYFQITADAGTYIRADLEKIETGTILGITPQVGPNGELTLSMNIEVSDVVARGELGLPVINRRTARSTVQVESGGTAAIAGLSDTSSRTDQSGVPGARNTPLLGRAFRTDRLVHQARQVAVFVTATVIGEDEKRFSNGHKESPAPVVVSDDEAFRRELAAALAQLQGGVPR